MIKNVLLVLLLSLCLLIYTLFLKPTKPIEPPIKEQKKPVKQIPLQEIPKPPKEVPKIELNYYNLFLENDYSLLYKHSKDSSNTDHLIPPLLQENIQKEDDLDITLTPEFNFDKQTKEITIGGAKIQLEKKF
mgnify:CR=1 FL=1